MDPEERERFLHGATPPTRRVDPKPAEEQTNQSPNDVGETLVEANVRIAIGCQSPTARESLIREVCDRAVGSARALP